MRLKRWILCLSLFKYKVVYKTRKSNTADVISRLSEGDTRQSGYEEDVDYIRWVKTNSVPRTMTLEEIAAVLAKDKKIKEVKLWLQTNNWDTLKDSRYKILKEHNYVFIITYYKEIRV